MKSNKKRAGIEQSERVAKACLVAVGGAKGGVGKSMFATNLAVQLSRTGHRTVVVDLDLGGANQHLYLGHRSLLASTMNDFVRGRVRTLEEVTVETRYGPRLIGGNSSELGSANLTHGRKLKMLRAIRDIDADYVILDLGGDTSYNIVDCFNLADFGIVVATRESAAYVGAYQFIKIALYRKLQRAFGTESRFATERDAELERVLKDLTSAEAANGRSIAELVADVRARAPESVPLLLRLLDDFRPLLVTNRIPKGIDVAPLVRSLQDVMQRWLSKDVRHLGSVSAQREIEASAIELVPVLAKHPNGVMAHEMARIAERLAAQARPEGVAPFEEEVDPADVLEEIDVVEQQAAAHDAELEAPAPATTSVATESVATESVATESVRVDEAEQATAPTTVGAHPPGAEASEPAPASVASAAAKAPAPRRRSAAPRKRPAKQAAAAAVTPVEVDTSATPEPVASAPATPVEVDTSATPEPVAPAPAHLTEVALASPEPIARAVAASATATAASAKRPSQPVRMPLHHSEPPRPSRALDGLGLAAARAGSVPVPISQSVVAAPRPSPAEPVVVAPAVAQVVSALPAANDAVVSVEALEWEDASDGLAWPGTTASVAQSR